MCMVNRVILLIVQGFVDDMAQDMSDVLAFVHQHCDIYCMDRVLHSFVQYSTLLVTHRFVSPLFIEHLRPN